MNVRVTSAWEDMARKASSIHHIMAAGRRMTISDIAEEAPHVGVPHALPGHGTHRKG
jgi:hypothetical protein